MGPTHIPRLGGCHSSRVLPDPQGVVVLGMSTLGVTLILDLSVTGTLFLRDLIEHELFCGPTISKMLHPKGDIEFSLWELEIERSTPFNVTTRPLGRTRT